MSRFVDWLAFWQMPDVELQYYWDTERISREKLRFRSSRYGRMYDLVWDDSGGWLLKRVDGHHDEAVWDDPKPREVAEEATEDELHAVALEQQAAVQATSTPDRDPA